MNMKWQSVGLIALLVCELAVADPISEQTTWQHSYAVSSSAPRLLVRNIWGNVTVRPGTAREILVVAHERRSAPTRELLEKSKERLRLDVQATGEGVALLVGDPNRTDGRTDVCRGCRLEYQFEIAVPSGAQVDVGTVTDGRVEVSGVGTLVSVRNVNGPVAVRDVNGCTNIESVNGALDVTFARAPVEDCTIKTINGEITVGLPADAGLDAVLSVTHGRVESDFDVEPVALPIKLDKQERDEKFSYRIEQPAGLRVGAGGPTITFASLNGDVRIRKNK
jgi:hypothetical protein